MPEGDNLPQELAILALTAASVGAVHTLLGPDHYLPFIVMARAGKWSYSKTTWITLLCGLGHVGSSIALGLAGIALGGMLTRFQFIEAWRGNLAAWALIAFGLLYCLWGLRRAARNQPHQHRHFHGDGSQHEHEHVHAKEHVHAHETEATPNLTPWILFTIFVFGPCEPLIPLVMYAMAKGGPGRAAMVSGVFGAATLAVMLGVVLVSLAGVKLIPLNRFERYSHALAGAAVLMCGLAIQFLGL